MNMLRTLSILVLMATIATLPRPVGAQEDNQCLTCHGTQDLWEGDTLHLFVTADHLAGDVHWQKGLLCQDCHGGNATTFDLREAHAIEDGFRKIETPSDIPGFCGHCHSDAEYMQRFRPDAPTDLVERFTSSVHGRHLTETGGERATTCLSCHPAHEMRLASDPQAVTHVQRLSVTCGQCHEEQLVDLRRSVHAKAGERNGRGAGTLLDCGKCHGADVHGIVPVQQADSPVFLDHQVRVCGECHEKYLETYNTSVHGQGLIESGLLVTAACSDCHGAHGVYYAADRRSTLHHEQVADTCGKCHFFLKERLADSVHGPDTEPHTASTVAEARRRKPSCTDCHPRHDASIPGSIAFRLELPDRCGNCHPHMSERYRLSLHGELTQLGYQPAAECADCHGAHDILPVQDPESRLAGAHRVETCRWCHPNAVTSFTKFDPHANHKDAERYPLLHGVYVWMEVIIYSLVGISILHAILWFLRSFMYAHRHGRHRILASQQAAIIRFGPLHRVVYVVLLASFAGLVLTGLPLKFNNYEWAQRFVRTMGGFETTRELHHFCAVSILCACLMYVIWAVKQIFDLRREHHSWSSLAWGPDSPLFNKRDAKDLLGMVRWFLGIGEKPTFERWTYWEKLDYWAVYLGVIVIGASGLMLWFPNFASRLLPGEMLNLAKMVHAELALFAGASIFVIHLFSTHLRPEKFPLDLSLFTGMVDEEHLTSARPEFVERMRREGTLEAVRTLAPARRRLRTVFLTGFLVLFMGLVLVAALMLANLSK